MICNGPNTAIRFREKADYSSLRTKYINDKKEIVSLCKKNKKKKKKSIIFTSSKDTGEKLLEELGKEKVNAFFLTAENRNSKDGKKLVKTLSQKGCFSSDVLIATAVLDVGVSIKDPDLTQIFIRSYNQEEFIQMLGRVRVPPEKRYEGITLYINKIKQQYVDQRLDRERDIIKSIELARKKDDIALALANGELNRLTCPFLYCTTERVEISELAVYRHRELFEKYKEISEGMSSDPDFFLIKQLGWLGLEETYSVKNYVSEEVREEIKKEVVGKLEKIYLEYKEKELVGRKELASLLGKIKPIVRRLDGQIVRSNVDLSMNKFNKVCTLEKFPYSISKKRGRLTHYKLVKNS